MVDEFAQKGPWLSSDDAPFRCFFLPPFCFKLDGDAVGVTVQRFSDNSPIAKCPNAPGNTSTSCKL